MRGPIALIAAVSFVSSLGIGVMLPLMPLYALSLGASPLQLGLMTSVFALANTAGQMLSGLRMDRSGSLPFIRGGTGLYAAANALIATAQDAASLIAYRGIAGLGAGANVVGSRVYLAQVAPPERMGLVNGILGSVGAAGSVIGPAFGGGVVALSDLRAPFVIVAVTSGLALLGLLALPRPQQVSAPRADAPASALNRSVLTLLLANGLLSAGYGGFITAYAPYATEIRAWTLFEVGLLFTVAGSGSIVFGAAMGHLADRIGRRRVAVFAPIPASLMGFGMVLGLERVLVYATMFVAGAAIAGFTASWFALLNDASPEGRKGRTFGMVSALSNMGTIFGALGASLLWQFVGVEYGLILASTFLLLAGPALLLIPAQRPRSQTVASAITAA